MSSIGRRVIDGGSEFETRLAYSRAVVHDDYVFVAGTTGYNYRTMKIATDPTEQTRQCFKNIKGVLEEAGTTLAAIVRIRYIVTNRAIVDECAAVFREFLGAHRPAATLIIAELLDEAMHIEIEVTASRGGA